jgi:hypothetical protein
MRLGLSLLALTLCLTGCMSQYSPAAPIAPLLSRQGQVVAGARFRPAFPRRGVSAHVAAAPTEHARLYLSGTWSRARGVEGADYAGRTLKEHNDTRQVELAAGWGTVTSAVRLEVLGGGGYGRVDAAGCRRNEFQGYDYCTWWVDGVARFGRVFVQAQAAREIAWWTGGGGVRVLYAHYEFERQFGRTSDFSPGVAAVEPFIVHRVAVPFGAIELMLHIPILLVAPRVDVPQSDPRAADQDTVHRQRLLQIPMPRLYLGFVGELDALWR